MNTEQRALNIYANILFAASISIIKCETKTKQNTAKKPKKKKTSRNDAKVWLGQPKMHRENFKKICAAKKNPKGSYIE